MPGFVSEIVVPSKSETLILPVRARVTTSSAAAANSAKFIFSAPLTLGTRSVREPSAFGHVHGEAEPDLLAAHARRLAARAVEGVVHGREAP